MRLPWVATSRRETLENISKALSNAKLGTDQERSELARKIAQLVEVKPLELEALKTAVRAA